MTTPPISTHEPDCEFCQRIADPSSASLANEQRAVAFLVDLSQALAPGQVVVASRAHEGGLLSATDVGLASTFGLVRRIARAVVEGLAADDVVVHGASNAPTTGASDHLHFHVIPRWADDGATFWPTDRSGHVVQAGVSAGQRVGLRYAQLFGDRQRWAYEAEPS